MSDISRFFKHSSIYAIGNLINRIGAFLLLPVYTNYLTVSEFGTIELYYVIVAVASGILAVGMAHATLRFYFDYDSIDDRNASISTNYIGSFTITTVGVLSLSMFASEIAREVFDSDQYTLGIYLVFASLVFELSTQICLAYIRAREFSTIFVIVSIVKLVMQVSVNTYLVVVEGAGVTGVLTGNLITVFVGWLALSIFTLYHCGFTFHLKKFIPVLKYCLPFLLSTIVALLSSNAGKFILNYLVSLEALGIFALALKFSMILEQMIGEPFSNSYGAFRYTIMKNQDAGRLQADIVRYLMIVAVFAALGISLFVSDLLMIISKEEFWPAATIVPLLMIASVFKLMTYPFQTGILYAKQTKYLFYFDSVSAVLSLTFNLLLIYFVGIIGACVSLIITKAVGMLLTNHYAQKFFEVPYEVGKLAMIFAIGVGIYLSSLFLSGLNPWLEFGVKVMLMGLFVGLMFTTPALNKTENAKIKSFIATHVLKRSVSS